MPNNSYRYIDELNSIAGRLGEHKRLLKDVMFNVNLSQRQSQRSMQSQMAKERLEVKKFASSKNQSLFDRALKNMPTFGESFFSSFLPSASAAIGNKFLQGKRESNFDRQRTYMDDLIKSLNEPTFVDARARSYGLEWETPEVGK